MGEGFFFFFFYLFCGQGEKEECLMVQEDSDGRDGLY
jgi:hypothetical protein